jgi:hypothetical protein
MTNALIWPLDENSERYFRIPFRSGGIDGPNIDSSSIGISVDGVGPLALLVFRVLSFFGMKAAIYN